MGYGEQGRLQPGQGGHREPRGSGDGPQGRGDGTLCCTAQPVAAPGAGKSCPACSGRCPRCHVTSCPARFLPGFTGNWPGRFATPCPLRTHTQTETPPQPHTRAHTPRHSLHTPVSCPSPRPSPLPGRGWRRQRQDGLVLSVQRVGAGCRPCPLSSTPLKAGVSRHSRPGSRCWAWGRQRRRPVSHATGEGDREPARPRPQLTCTFAPQTAAKRNTGRWQQKSVIFG